MHVDALWSAMQSNTELFAPVLHYVKEIGRVLRLPNPEKSTLSASAEKIGAFYSDYGGAKSSPGFFYVPPGEISNTRTTATDVCELITKLTELPDDQFVACFRPQPRIDKGSRPKPHPKDVAQVCRNGHLVLGSLREFPQFRKSFCEDCGEPTIEQCQTCSWPIAGVGPDSWMSGSGPYKPPKYCGECGNPFPWTERALAAAREYADDLDQLSPDERTALKGTFPDLTIDTARTPLAASRFRKFIDKIGPVAGAVLQKIVETIATEAAKKSIGL